MDKVSGLTREIHSSRASTHRRGDGSGAASTATRTGPTMQQHGRHPRLAQHRQAHAAGPSGARPATLSQTVRDQLGQRRGRRPTRTSAPGRSAPTARRLGVRLRSRGTRAAPKWLAACAWATASGSSSDITVAPRRRSSRARVRVRALSPPNWPTTTRHVGHGLEAGAQALALADGGDARGRCRSGRLTRIERPHGVGAAHAVGGDAAVRLEVRQRARPCAGRRCRRPGRSRSRGAPDATAARRRRRRAGSAR